MPYWFKYARCDDLPYSSTKWYLLQWCDLCWSLLQTWKRIFIHIVTFTPLVLFLCYYRNLIVFKIIWNWTVCITKPPSYEISLLKKKNICVTLYLFIFVILSLLILLILLFLCDLYGCNQKIFLNNYVKEISLKKSVRECCKLKKLERIKIIIILQYII